MKTNFYPIARRYCVIFLFCLAATASYAQQALVVDQKSLILPRYANYAAISSAIPSPTQGTQVYNIETQSNWYYDGTYWVDLKPLWITNGTHIYNPNGGFVGIGTNNPSAPLDVKSTAHNMAIFNGGYTMYLSLLEEDVMRGYIGSLAGADEDVDFGTANVNANGKVHLTIQQTPKFTLKPDGNIGIGTTDPTARLDLVSGGNTNSTKALRLKNSSNTDLVTVNDIGQVGIGTASPSAVLDVKSTVGTQLVKFNGNDAMYLGLWENDIFRGYIGSSVGDPQDVDFGNGQVNGKIHLTILSEPKLTVNSVGNVGIGTTTPAVRLDVNANVRNVAAFNGADRMFISLNETNLKRGYLGSYAGAAEDIDFGTEVGNTNGKVHLTIESDPKFTLNSSGNVGIATTDPKAKLHINGTMLVGANTARVASGYSLSVDGNVIAESFTTLNSLFWPDYVFEKDYKLLPLEELEKSIQQHKHLPNIPSAAEIEKNGINLGEMNKKLMEKIEELTLYMIELNKKNTALTEKLEKLEKEVSRKK